MSQHSNHVSLRQDEKRLNAFLDCVARLLARRWLREQRKQPDKPPKKPKESLDEDMT